MNATATPQHIATAALIDFAHPQIVEWARERIEAGTLAWIADPHALGVYGLTDADQGYPTSYGSDAPVYVIAYVDEGDFEVTDRGYDAILGG